MLFAQTWTRAHRPGGIDLTTYLEAAHAVERGGSPYSLPLAFPYIYPPFLAFALIPLGRLPADVVLGLWFAGSIAAILWTVRQVVFAAHPDLRRRALTPFLALFLAALYPIVQSNLRNGQVNFLVVALAIAALVGRDAARRGAGWGAAVAIKILPAALAPFFVRRVDWRVPAAALAVLALACIAPAAALGSHVGPVTLEYWSSFLRGSFRVGGTADVLDFSVGGILTRAIGADGQVIRQLGTALPVAAIFLIDLLRRREAARDAHLFALYLAVIPLASPKSEVHHLAFALPAAALALAAVWFGTDRRPAFVAWLGVAAAAYVAALVLPASAGLLWFGALLALVCAGCMGLTSR